MSADNNELKFTAKLDVKPIIQAAKTLATEVREATKIKSDNPLIAKGVEYLAKQNAEIREKNKQLWKQDRYTKEIASHNRMVTEFEEKQSRLADLINGKKSAEKEIRDRTGKAIGVYAGRTDKPALENERLLNNAKTNLTNIEAEMAKIISEVDKLLPKLEASYERIQKAEKASAELVGEYSKTAEAAKEMDEYSKGISEDNYKTTAYVKEQRVAIREAEMATKAYSKTARDSNQDIASTFEETADKTTKSAVDSATKAQEAFEKIKTARQSLGDDWGLNFEADVTKMDDASLTRRRDELLSVANAFRAIKIPEEYADFFNRLNQALIETQTQLNKVHGEIKSSFDISNMKVPDLAADVAKMGEGELKNYKNELKAFMKTLEGMGATTEQVYYDASVQLAKTDIQLKQVKADVKDVAMEQMGLKKEPVVIDIDADTASMHILQLINYYDQLVEEKKRLRAIQDPTKEDSEYYDKVVQKLAEADIAIKKLQGDYQEVSNKAEETTNANEEFANSFKLFSDTFVSISQANGFLGQTKALLGSLGPAAMTAGLMSQEALTMATGGLNLLIEIVARVLTAIEAITNAFKTLASSIANAFRKALDMIKELADYIKNALTKAADKAKSVFDKISGAFSFSNSDLKRTLQMLTKYIFGVRSFFFLYRKLRSAVKEGLENLVQFESGSNETNKAITELRTSLLYLKNAWAAAFAPIINYVYPILVKFMDALASIGNAIARFVAALTGQKTVLQALRVDAGDYAESLDKAGGSAGKAAKEQDKLNDKLAAFDDLNVLGIDDDTSPSTGGGGGGGADDLLPSIDEMFERIKTPANDWVEMLKKAFESGDGFELGETIARYLNKGLEGAHEWLTGEGREKIYKIANLIGTTLDGILSDDKLAGNLGQVLADLFSDAMLFINTVITPERMYMIGVRIAEVFNTAIPQIVPELGKTLGNLLRSAISSAWGFISTADFASWGVALGEAINNFFSEMGTAKGVLGGIEFTHSGWQLFGMTVTEFAQKILDFFINVINEVDWNQIGEAIGDFLGGIDTDAINKGLDKLWTTIKNALSSMWDSFSEANPKAQTTLQPFADVFTTIVEILPSLISKLEELAGKLLDLITPHLQSFIENLPETLTLVFNAIVKIADILESVFGVVDTGIDYIEEATSDATSFLDLMGSISGMTFGAIGGPVALGAEIGENARIGLGGSSRSTSDDLSQLMFGVSMDEIAQSLGKNSSAITANLKDIQEHLKGVGETADRVKGDFNFDSIATNIKGMVSESTNSLGEIPTKFTDIKSSADAQSTGIKDKFVSTFGDIKNQSIDSAKAVQDNFLLASDNIKDSFINAWGEIKKSISEGGDMFVSLSDGMGNTVKSLLNAMINGINISITKPLQDISKSFNVLRTLDVNGSRPFAGIPYLNVPTIPHLAQGAVIPPNKQFMAVLGDQTSGTNIEAPLDTIRQAVGDELAPYLQQLIEINAQVITAINNKNLTIGDRQIGQANARYTARQNMVRGTSM